MRLRGEEGQSTNGTARHSAPRMRSPQQRFGQRPAHHAGAGAGARHVLLICSIKIVWLAAAVTGVMLRPLGASGMVSRVTWFSLPARAAAADRRPTRCFLDGLGPNSVDSTFVTEQSALFS